MYDDLTHATWKKMETKSFPASVKFMRAAKRIHSL